MQYKRMMIKRESYNNENSSVGYTGEVHARACSTSDVLTQRHWAYCEETINIFKVQFQFAGVEIGYIYCVKQGNTGMSNVMQQKLGRFALRVHRRQRGPTLGVSGQRSRKIRYEFFT